MCVASSNGDNLCSCGVTWGPPRDRDLAAGRCGRPLTVRYGLRIGRAHLRVCRDQVVMYQGRPIQDRKAQMWSEMIAPVKRCAERTASISLMRLVRNY